MAFTRNRRIPLNIRRQVGLWFIPWSDQTFTIDIGSEFRGCLDNYLEWLAWVTGDYFEYPYLNLIRRLHHGGVVLDVGANVGTHALAFSEFFNQVHAVEPYPPLYEKLAGRRAISDRIHPHQLALSDRAGSVPFLAPNSANMGIGRITESGDIQVEAMRGDDFVAAQIKDPIDFIKIDVEGHETEVIKGLGKTLRRDRPTVMFEASKAVMKSSESIRACFDRFPDDYVFCKLSGQSTWPIQRDTARVRLIDPDRPTRSRHSCDMLCWGREKEVDIDALNR